MHTARHSPANVNWKLAKRQISLAPAGTSQNNNHYYLTTKILLIIIVPFSSDKTSDIVGSAMLGCLCAFLEDHSSVPD